MSRETLSFNRIIATALLPSLLALGGCQKYKDQIANQSDIISELNTDKRKLETDRDNLTDEKETLSSEKAALEDRIAELDSQIQSLLDYRKSLEEKLEQLGVDKTKITAEYTRVMSEQQELIDKMRKQQEQAKQRLDVLKNMLSKFKSLIAGGKLSVRIRNGRLTLELPSAVLFPLGEAELSSDGKKTLSAVASVLKEIKNRDFQVAGHTDNVRIKSGRFQNNWALSTARAVSVVLFLEKKRVPSKRLSAAGYSKFQPAAKNNTKKRRAQNRRIEITLMPNLDELPNLSALENILKR